MLVWAEGCTLKISYMALARGFSSGLLTHEIWLSPRANGPRRQRENVHFTKTEVVVLYNLTLEVTYTITSPTFCWSHKATLVHWGWRIPESLNTRKWAQLRAILEVTNLLSPGASSQAFLRRCCLYNGWVGCVGVGGREPFLGGQHVSILNESWCG